jgi:hypothetical protein
VYDRIDLNQKETTVSTLDQLTAGDLTPRHLTRTIDFINPQNVRIIGTLNSVASTYHSFLAREDKLNVTISVKADGWTRTETLPLDKPVTLLPVPQIEDLVDALVEEQR